MSKEYSKLENCLKMTETKLFVHSLQNANVIVMQHNCYLKF